MNRRILLASLVVVASVLVFSQTQIKLTPPAPALVGMASDPRFMLTNTSPQTLTINGTMSNLNPAVIIGGSTPYKFTTPSTIVVSGQPVIGSVCICFDAATGMLTVYHELDLNYAGDPAFKPTITGTADLLGHVFSGSMCPFAAQLWQPTMSTPGVWDLVDERADTRGFSYALPVFAPSGQ